MSRSELVGSGDPKELWPPAAVQPAVALDEPALAHHAQHRLRLTARPSFRQTSAQTMRNIQLQFRFQF